MDLRISLTAERPNEKAARGLLFSSGPAWRGRFVPAIRSKPKKTPDLRGPRVLGAKRGASQNGGQRFWAAANLWPEGDASVWRGAAVHIRKGGGEFLTQTIGDGALHVRAV